MEPTRQDALDALCGLRRKRIWRGRVQRLSGIGVSPGLGAGRAVVLIQRAQVIRFAIPAGSIDGEIARLEAAGKTSAEQLGAHPGSAAGARPWDAVRSAASDARRSDAAAARGLDRREQRVNAEWALQQVFDHLGAIFDGVDDPYLRERKGDLADVVGRLRMNLTSRRRRTCASCWASAKRRACSWPTSFLPRLPLSSTGGDSRPSSPMRAAARITRRFSRGRSTCPRSWGFTTRRGKSCPGR